MTAIAALTLTDAAATPVNHTFSPVNIDAAGVAKFADRSGGIAIGFPVFSLSLKTPTAKSRVYRGMAKLVVPTLEVTSPSTSTGIQPAPIVAYNTVMTCEFVLPERSTLQQRKDAWAMMKDALSDAVLTAAIENFESIY